MKTRARQITVTAIALLGLTPDLGIIPQRNENVIFIDYHFLNITIH